MFNIIVSVPFRKIKHRELIEVITVNIRYLISRMIDTLSTSMSKYIIRYNVFSKIKYTE